ncbi:hypothetical protein T265_15743, partial [Opisthorchis viverrini]
MEVISQADALFPQSSWAQGCSLIGNMIQPILSFAMIPETRSE